MKCNLHFSSLYKSTFAVIAFVFISSSSFSQTFYGVSSSPLDGGAQAGPTVTIVPPGGMMAGDLAIIYAQYRSNGATININPLETGGQAWNSGAAYSPNPNSNNQRIFIAWCRFNGTWTAPNPSVTVGTGTLPMSVVMYVFRPSSASNLWGVNVNQTNTLSNTQTGNSINSVTTTMTNTVTMAFWSNSSTTTWNNLTGTGWSKASLSNQYRNTSGSGQSHTAAYYIQTTTRGATGAVSQDQGASTNTLRSIMSWHELTNDNCSNAIPIPTDVTCTNTPGSLSMATNSGIGTAPCTGAADDDVWYSFVATDPLQAITLSSVNATITSVLGGGGINTQVFSGTCGALTPIACGTTNTTMVPGLTVGNTYYVRIYSLNSTQIITAAGFNICVIPPAFFGKSFINITKGTTGGTVETGDEIEIRASIVLRGTGSAFDSCAFFHTIPPGTTYKPGSLAILTNEGKIYKSFTDVVNDDEGSVTGSAVSINMGYNQTINPSNAFRRGRITSGDRPVVGGGTLMLATYRVFVTQTLNNTINVGGGSFTYSLPANPTNIFTKTFGDNFIKVYINDGLCDNATGVNVLANTIAGDFDGTFGSGNTMNRVASPNVPSGLIYTTMKGNDPSDFFYSVTNNTSRNAAGFSTTNSWPKPQSPAINRVYGVFDVIGDHTNASDPLAGNTAADTTSGQTGGYMLLVNTAYNLDTVFKYSITGLCPNTYYEISSWVRNICSRCGVDSIGNGAAGIVVPPGYIPTAPGDSSGVYPNLSFSVDGVNHYTTGNITYTGQWVKKGFTFLTGPSQTSITLAIANNAPGGGGNDWAIDDIEVSTCLPSLTMRPSNSPGYCLNASINLSVAVSTFYNNYTYYQWERNTGSGWGPAPEMPGMQTFTYTSVPPNYLDTVAIPTFIATGAMNGYQYRIRAATTSANLAVDNCSIYNSTDIITINVNPSCDVLPVDLLRFAVHLKNNEYSQLSWVMKNENGLLRHEVQRSEDGINFRTIGTVNAFNRNTEAENYSFADPLAISGKAYYRIKVIGGNNDAYTYSKILSVSTNQKNRFEINNLVNPFHSNLSFQLTSSTNEEISVELMDAIGRPVLQQKMLITKGANAMNINVPAHLQNGSYLLRIVSQAGVIHKVIQKQ
jgi:trimeric autotransporter adhesin